MTLTLDALHMAIVVRINGIRARLALGSSSRPDDMPAQPTSGVENSPTTYLMKASRIGERSSGQSGRVGRQPCQADARDDRG